LSALLFERASRMTAHVGRIEIGNSHPLAPHIDGIAVDHPDCWTRTA
jgi:hypothetical protein